MCVQDVDVQCVLQFTLLHAAGCALHRHASRVIHRLELFHSFVFSKLSRTRAFALVALVKLPYFVKTRKKWRDGATDSSPLPKQTATRQFFEPAQAGSPL